MCTAESRFCVSEIFLSFWFIFYCNETPKKEHSYLFCYGCALIRHAAEQSLRAYSSEPDGGRELFDLLRRRRREKRFLKAEGGAKGGFLSRALVFLSLAVCCAPGVACRHAVGWDAVQMNGAV